MCVCLTIFGKLIQEELLEKKKKKKNCSKMNSWTEHVSKGEVKTSSDL